LSKRLHPEDVLRAIDAMIAWAECEAPSTNAEGRGSAAPVPVPASAPASRPSWDRAAMELRYGARECRRYKRVARLQFMVLDAFEKAGWPPSIKRATDC
jgi:hypothetical protein